MTKPTISPSRLRKVLLALVPCEGVNVANIDNAIRTVYNIGNLEIALMVDQLVREGRLQWAKERTLYRVPSDE